MSKKREIDELLTQVYSKHEGPMQEMNFLNSVFAFINRRSDVLGQPGVIKQVTNVLQKNIDVKHKEIESRQAKEKTTNENKQNESNKSTTQETHKEDVVIKEQIKTQEISTNTDNNNNNNNNNNNENDNKNIEVPNKSEEKKNETKPTVIHDEEEAESGTPPPVGNGGKTDRYVWTQTLYEVEMKLKVPSDITKRELNISVQKNKIFIQLKKTKEILINGEPHGSIDADESSWTLDQEHGATQKTLTLVLPKKKDMCWWPTVIKGDPEINVRKISPENSKLSDLDDETRVTVEKMMFDQQQKMKGKPTSKELEQQKILEQFKKAHPEFDFSQMKTN